MNARNIASQFLKGFLLALLCAAPFFLHAQTEAQAGSDVLEIQNVRSGRTTLLEPGDAVKYPVKKGKFNVEEKADVVSVEGDNEIVVRNRGGENETVSLKLDELKYFRRLNRARIVVGWTLLGIGLLVKLVVALSVTAALISAWGVGAAILVFLLVLVFEYFSPIVLLAGILLIVSGRRRIFKPKWSWKRKRLSRAK